MMTSKELLNKVRNMRTAFNMSAAAGSSKKQRLPFQKYNFKAGESKTVLLLRNAQYEFDPYEYKFSHTFLRTFNVIDTCPLTYDQECPVCNIMRTDTFWQGYRQYVKNKIRGVYKNIAIKQIIRIYFFDTIAKNIFVTYFYDEDAVAFLNFFAEIENAPNGLPITITRGTDYKFSFTHPTQGATVNSLDPTDIDKIKQSMQFIKAGPMDVDETVTSAELLEYFKRYIASVSTQFYALLFGNTTPEMNRNQMQQPTQQQQQQNVPNLDSLLGNTVNVGQAFSSTLEPQAPQQQPLDDEMF